MSDFYKTLKEPCEGLYKEKMSKFISFAHPVNTAEEAKEIIKRYQKEYFDARHVCWAYMIGTARTEYQSNDNGEPSGTAGKPILGQINSFELTNVVIVVIRYFGGIKLGTSGLIVAYREAAAEAIRNGDIDGVALGRAGLADGAYPQKLMRGRPDMIHPCIACGNCMASSFSKVSATCAVNPIGMRPGQYPLTRAVQPKKVLVVGGGVGGMETARIAAMRGHQVTLAEQSERLGGRLFDAGRHAFKQDIRALADWYTRELRDVGVSVTLGRAMTTEDIQASGADVVVLSVGADAVMPRSIPGIDHPKAVSCTDVLEGKRLVGKKVAIIGAGLVGAEMAYDMAREEGKDVVLVDGLDDILSNDPDGVPFQTRWMLNELLDLHGVQKYMGHMLDSITEEGCVLKSKTGELIPIEADDVIIAIGFRARKSMYESLYGADMEVYEIVAGNGIGSIASQVNTAYEIARNL